MNCTQFLLTWYNNLTVVFSVVAIIITIIISGGQSGQASAVNGAKEKKNNIILRMLFAVLILGGAIFISGKSLEQHNVWTIVPNLYGRTYDDAMSILYENRLGGQLALASTNENLSNSDSRIVWQSCKEGEPVKVDTTISFLIDDRFSLDSVPLDQYIYKDELINQSKKLNYKKIENEDTKGQVEAQDRIGKGINVPDDYYFAPSHWNVEIEAFEISFNATSSVSQGKTISTMYPTYSYNLYAGPMSSTLAELVKKSIISKTDETAITDWDRCIVVGKLIPMSGKASTVLKRISVQNDDEKGIFFLPQTLGYGEYKFVFSIIDSKYNMFEWYHNITIVNNLSIS